MSGERRRHLAALADRYGFVIVEDDPYGALRFVGAPIASISTLSANVVTLGSTSKTLAPGLRVGWALLPPWLIGPMARQKQAADLHTSSLAQAVVASALRSSWYPDHVSRLCGAYGARAEALFDALEEHPEVFARPRRAEGGMFAWVRLRGAVEASELLPEALSRGVAFVPGAAFSDQGRYRDHVRLSFATLHEAAFGEAVARLAAVAAAAERSVTPV